MTTRFLSISLMVVLSVFVSLSGFPLVHIFISLESSIRRTFLSIFFFFSFFILFSYYDFPLFMVVFLDIVGSTFILFCSFLTVLFFLYICTCVRTQILKFSSALHPLTPQHCREALLACILISSDITGYQYF